jgi:hypothetical protein
MAEGAQKPDSIEKQKDCEEFEKNEVKQTSAIRIFAVVELADPHRRQSMAISFGKGAVSS